MQWPKAARDESDKATTWLFDRGDKERQRCIGDDGLYAWLQSSVCSTLGLCSYNVENIVEDSYRAQVQGEKR